MTSNGFSYDENPQYIFDLLLSVITVNVETVDIVAGLSKVEWE
jgi:predicted helicase